MREYQLHWAAYHIQKAKQCGNEGGYFRTLTWQDRLRIANYLNSIAYNYPENNPPKMDKTAFSYRAR
ncbi:hypothetical protein [Mucilaginibacter aquariorum]|uniref:Uncharacterized protein n=1 Tax=Mucilaginibacter aquariorum TaxID=2967225 RepID=A0ABT1T7E9_9SPHI|nr:hypothetical protein [Mucilaginibacter aquariorum]MCQ6960551.1 hypothetical protein [Mucilaginibacter aquariorum]